MKTIRFSARFVKRMIEIDPVVFYFNVILCNRAKSNFIQICMGEGYHFSPAPAGSILAKTESRKISREHRVKQGSGNPLVKNPPFKESTDDALKNKISSRGNLLRFSFLFVS